MTSAIPQVFLATVLLEPFRWHPRGTKPALEIADWTKRISDQFEGIELWEPHWLFATPAQRREIERTSANWIFNSYAPLARNADASRSAATEAAHRLRARGVKCNFGADASQLLSEIEVAHEWALALPTGCKLLLECHSGTSIEEPSSAAKALAGLPREKVGIIAHPFTSSKWDEWIQKCGTSIDHLHAQARKADQSFDSLGAHSELISRRLESLSTIGFCGTIALEFTLGVTSSGQDDPHLLWNQVLNDQQYLESALRRIGWQRGLVSPA